MGPQRSTQRDLRKTDRSMRSRGGLSMSQGHGIDISALEKKVTDLSNALAHLSTAEDFKKLILILKRPGWTTPAEFTFASAIIDSMLGHTRALAAQKQELLKGAESVAPK